MTREPLDYASPQQSEKLPRQQCLGWIMVIVPFIILPCYVTSTALLKDEFFVDGFPDSWHRAALRAGIPSGLITLVALACAIRAVKRMGWRSAAGVAVAANTLALVIIAYGMFSA